MEAEQVCSPSKVVKHRHFFTRSSSPASFVALHTTSPRSLWVSNIEANEFTVEGPASGKALVFDDPAVRKSGVSLVFHTSH